MTAKKPYGAKWKHVQGALEGFQLRSHDCVRVRRLVHLGAMTYRDLIVLDASERAADQVNELIERPSGRRLLHVWQIRDSVQSIAANIAEGFGRGTGRDRARLLRIARGEAEETIRHLAANFRAKRIAQGDYWAIRNRLVVIVKMLNRLTYP